MTKLKLFLFIFILPLSFQLKAELKSGLRGNPNEEAINKYFERNLSELDPIEGIYSITEEDIVHDSYGNVERVVEPPFSCYIYQSAPNTFTAISFDKEFGIKDITRIGKTNTYRIKTNPSQFPHNVEVNSGNIENRTNIGFLVRTNINDKRYHVRIEMLWTFKKVYHTEKDIESAPKSKPSSWAGTGFSIGKNYIVTNNHVIEGARRISIIAPDTKIKYNGLLVATDKSNDLALLKITNVSFKEIEKIPYKICSELGSVGESVFVLGYPLTSTMGEDIKLTTGIISSLSGYEGDHALYQISAPIQPGNSGGPLFDHKGNVIGVICAKHNAAENAGYAVKSSFLENLIKSTGITISSPITNFLSNLSLPQQVERIKNYVYLIECEK